MEQIPELIDPPMDPQVCRILQGIIALYETVLPGRIEGYYLQGSHADGTAVAASDIDLTIALREELNEQDFDVFWQVARTAILVSPVTVDTFPFSVNELRRSGFWLKSRSRLLYGRDMRPEIPDATPRLLLVSVMHRPFESMLRLRGAETIVYPVTAPDVEGEFLGYDVSRGFRAHHPYRNSLKELAFIIALIAGAAVIRRSGQYVRSKPEAVAAYRELIADEWTHVVEGALQIRNDWGYKIPDSAIDRARLKEICAAMPAFENSYLRTYRDFLLSELCDARNAGTRGC